MIVYHYTSIDTLEKIFSTYSSETKSINLRATHCNYLNDGTESILGAQVLFNYVVDIEKELKIEPNWKLEPAFSNEKYIQHIVEHIKNYDDTKEQISKFVTSFSKERDNLVMWSMYGNKGNGVALGFDTEQLTQCLSDRKNVLTIEAKECAYFTSDELKGNCDKNSNLYNHAKNLYEYMTQEVVKKSIFEGTDKSLSLQERWNKVMNMIVLNLITHVSMFCKLDMWKNEQEYRLVIDNITRRVLYYKNANNVYIPYINVPVLLSSLKEIVIGPTCGRNAHGMINSLFFQRGLEANSVNIEHSNCPLQ